MKLINYFVVFICLLYLCLANNQNLTNTTEIESSEKQKFWDLIGIAISATALILQAIDFAQSSQQEVARGIFIRPVPVNFSCLDSKLGSDSNQCNNFVSLTKSCPDNVALRWWSLPPLLKSGNSCLDCNGWGKLDCDIQVNSNCHGQPWQQWTIKVDKDQVKQQENRVWFSIYSQMHPDRCMTYNSGSNQYKLSQCDSSPYDLKSFYIDYNVLDLIDKSNGNIFKDFIRNY